MRNWSANKSSDGERNAIVETLLHFPLPIVDECSDSWFGIARSKTSKGEVREWPPSAPEVAAWCEDLLAHCRAPANPRSSPARPMAPTDVRWMPIYERLKIKRGEAVALAWFAQGGLGEIVDGCATVVMPTLFRKNWVRTYYDEDVLQAVAAEYPGTVKVVFAVATTVLPERQPSDAERKQAGRNS
jgi:hypothetical protein